MNVNSHLHPMPATVSELRDLLERLPGDMPVAISSHGVFHTPAAQIVELRASEADACSDDGDRDDEDFFFPEEFDKAEDIQPVLVLYR